MRPWSRDSCRHCRECALVNCATVVPPADKPFTVLREEALYVFCDEEARVVQMSLVANATPALSAPILRVLMLVIVLRMCWVWTLWC